MALNLSGLGDLNLDAEEEAVASGVALKVKLEEIYEDPNNPRTVFDLTELREMAADIAQKGILQPIVVWPRDEQGYKIRYGAKRRRAALLAAETTGIDLVPVVINDAAHLDDYAQVSENLHRSGLTPMDMARFIERKVVAKQTKAEIAKRLGMAAGRIPEFLALLTLEEPLKALYDSGRCTSAQVLYMLSSLYKRYPTEVERWVEGAGEITKQAILQFEQGLLEGPRLPPEEDQSGGDSLPPEEGARRKASNAKAPARPDANIKALERRMTDTLGARSTIQFNPNTKVGTLRIKFTSLDELDGLLDRFGIPAEEG